MEMSGEQLLEVERVRVWAALHDPQTLKSCVPGCESIEKVSDTEFDLVMAAAIGPVRARFKGKLTLANIVPIDSYDIVFEGQGGVAGFAKGGARVALLEGESAAHTRLTYTVHASVGGKLAQVGSRLVDGAAKKIADAFFQRLHEALQGI